MLKPNVTVQLLDGILVAEFWDCLRLDPAPVADLKVRYEKHLRERGRADLVVDLNGVDFAGSSALGGFVSIQRLGRQHAGRVVVCNVAAQVREVFRVTKLDSLFAFADDVPSALAKLSNTQPRGAPDGAPATSAANDAPAEPPPAGDPHAKSPPPPLRLRRRKP